MWLPTNGYSVEVIRKILWIVLSVHFAFVLALCIHHFFWKETPKTRIVVRTIPQQTVAVVTSKSVKPKPAPVKQLANKPIAKPVPPVKTKTVEAPIAKAKSVAPVAKIKSETLPVPVVKEISLPKEILGMDEEQSSYAQTLIAYLQGCLDLPEFGEVKVEMEIDRFGHLVSCEILEAKSKKNGEFLKKRLPELVLPCFNDVSHETVIFTITFKNSTRIVR